MATKKPEYLLAVEGLMKPESTEIAFQYVDGYVVFKIAGTPMTGFPAIEFKEKMLEFLKLIP